MGKKRKSVKKQLPTVELDTVGTYKMFNGHIAAYGVVGAKHYWTSGGTERAALNKLNRLARG